MASDEDATVTGRFELGSVLVFAVTGLIIGTVFLDASGIAAIPRWIPTVLLPPIAGGATWILSGRPMFPTLLWIGLAWTALACCYFVVGYPWGGLGLALVYVVILAMMMSDRVQAWWLRFCDGWRSS
jgi:hypothetical protein